MGIANKRKWSNRDTANLAKALDEMGFEEDAESFMDDYVEFLSPSAMVDRLAEMIEDHVESIHQMLYNDMDALEEEFFAYLEDFDFDYEQIATEYVKGYVQKGYGGYAAVDIRPTSKGVAIRQWDGDSGQTSRNSKTSLKTNQKKPAPKKKPANARKPANRRK